MASERLLTIAEMQRLGKLTFHWNGGRWNAEISMGSRSAFDGTGHEIKIGARGNDLGDAMAALSDAIAEARQALDRSGA